MTENNDFPNFKKYSMLKETGVQQSDITNIIESGDADKMIEKTKSEINQLNFSSWLQRSISELSHNEVNDAVDRYVKMIDKTKSEKWMIEYHKCFGILTQLVALKLMKESGSDPEYYEKTKPSVWQEAIVFISNYEHL